MRLDPAIDMAGDIGRFVLTVTHAQVLRVDITDWQLHGFKQSGRYRIFGGKILVDQNVLAI